MEHEDQKSRLQKHLKRKQLGVRMNEDAIYIMQVEIWKSTPPLPRAAFTFQAFQALFRFCIALYLPLMRSYVRSTNTKQKYIKIYDINKKFIILEKILYLKNISRMIELKKILLFISNFKLISWTLFGNSCTIKRGNWKLIKDISHWLLDKYN